MAVRRWCHFEEFAGLRLKNGYEVANLNEVIEFFLFVGRKLALLNLRGKLVHSGFILIRELNPQHITSYFRCHEYLPVSLFHYKLPQRWTT